VAALHLRSPLSTIVAESNGILLISVVIENFQFRASDSHCPILSPAGSFALGEWGLIAREAYNAKWKLQVSAMKKTVYIWLHDGGIGGWTIRCSDQKKAMSIQLPCWAICHRICPNFRVPELLSRLPWWRCLMQWRPTGFFFKPLLILLSFQSERFYLEAHRYQRIAQQTNQLYVLAPETDFITAQTTLKLASKKDALSQGIWLAIVTLHPSSHSVPSVQSIQTKHSSANSLHYCEIDSAHANLRGFGLARKCKRLSYYWNEF